MNLQQLPFDEEDILNGLELINATDPILYHATNFHDKQVMEKLSELYTDGATSLQLLEYLNNFK